MKWNIIVNLQESFDPKYREKKICFTNHKYFTYTFTAYLYIDFPLKNFFIQYLKNIYDLFIINKMFHTKKKRKEIVPIYKIISLAKIKYLTTTFR